MTILSWWCPVCGIRRCSLPCAECGVCRGCCEAYTRPDSEAWLRSQGWSEALYPRPVSSVDGEIPMWAGDR